MALFTTPVELRPLAVDKPEYRPFHRIKGQVALSVLKNGSSYTTVENPTDEQVAAADIAYLGGRTYEISQAEADALTAAGYTLGVGESGLAVVDNGNGTFTITGLTVVDNGNSTFTTTASTAVDNGDGTATITY